MSRVSLPDFESLNSEQKRVYKEIAGPRDGIVGGPYTVWLRTPDIADCMNRVGDVLRVRGKLDKRLAELMILVVARHWNCDYQWVVHEDAARKSGLTTDVMEAIRHGRTPNITRADEKLIYDVITELVSTKKLSEGTYGRALQALGLDLLVELVTNAGRYTQAAMVCNAFDVPIPGGRRPITETPQ